MNIQNTTLCYIRRPSAGGEEYLMLYRNKKKNDQNAGKWIGVGGRFEPGESPEECLAREVREETGLVLTDCALRGIVTFVLEGWGTEYMFLYTAHAKGTLTECDEGELRWIPKSEVPSLPLWAGDRIFLSLIADERRPCFSLKLSYDKTDALTEALLDGVPLDISAI